MKKTARDWALLGRCWAELGAGRITEAFIHDGESFTEGFCSGQGHITINPAHATIDSLLHELLHRLYPAWGETYVRRTVTYLRRRMTDDEIVAMHDEYQRRARKRKSRLTLA